MRRWLLAAALVLALAASAHAADPSPRSLTVLQDTPLIGLDGTPAGMAQAFSAWDLVSPGPGYILAARFGPQGRPVPGRLLRRLAQRSQPVLWLFAPSGLPGPWWVPAEALLGPPEPQAGKEARVGLEALARVPAPAAILLPGPAARHAFRLARLRRANLPPAQKARLAAGHIKKGDNFWQVELALGRPQRSFMVNYISDEQHYVYLTPGGPLLLRFKGGHLAQVPPAPDSGPAQVANPPNRR